MWLQVVAGQVKRSGGLAGMMDFSRRLLDTLLPGASTGSRLQAGCVHGPQGPQQASPSLPALCGLLGGHLWARDLGPILSKAWWPPAGNVFVTQRCLQMAAGTVAAICIAKDPLRSARICLVYAAGPDSGPGWTTAALCSTRNGFNPHIHSGNGVDQSGVTSRAGHSGVGRLP